MEMAMSKYRVQVTFDMESESDELTLGEDVMSAVGEALATMVEADRAEGFSHLDVEAQEGVSA
jgi:hypothetical protein